MNRHTNEYFYDLDWIGNLMTQSDLERTFEHYWYMLATRTLAASLHPHAEYRFDKTRRWRFDFAWPEHHVAVELEGAVYAGGRHTRGKGYEGDLEKYNAATLQGWRVLRYTTGMLKNDPQRVIDEIIALLELAAQDWTLELYDYAKKTDT